MAAKRSRTHHWKDSLHQIYERSGCLELSLYREQDNHSLEPQTGADIVWRVKVLDISDDAITVEPPAAFGRAIPLCPGAKLVGAIVVGQNRWMFRSQTLNGTTCADPTSRGRLVIAMPSDVERCHRRAFYRMSTAALNLPDVTCWPLLDPMSVVAAETANRVMIQDLMSGRAKPSHFEGADDPNSITMPDVGPPFHAKLLNVSGGGLGLCVARQESALLEERPQLWLRVDLRPDICAPIAVTSRVAHKRLDSSQNYVVGLAFEFAHNAEHRDFIHRLFSHYVQQLQEQQRGSNAA